MSDSGECSSVPFSGDLALVRIIFSATFAVVIPYFVVLLALFVKRRKAHPISARPFLTTVLGLICITLWTSELCFVFILRQNHSCFYFLIFGWPVLALAMNVYLSRVWLLWFKFKITEEKSTLPPLPRIKLPTKLNLMNAVRKHRGQKKQFASIPEAPTKEDTAAQDSNHSVSPSISRNVSHSDMRRQHRGSTFREFLEIEMAEEVELYSPTPSKEASRGESFSAANYSNLTLDTSAAATDVEKICRRTHLNTKSATPTSPSTQSPCATPTVKSISISVSQSAFPESSPDTTPFSTPRKPPMHSTGSSIFNDMVPVPIPPARSSKSVTLQKSNSEKGKVGQARLKWYLAHSHWSSDRFMRKVFGIKAFIEWALLMSPVFTSNGKVYTEQLTDECWCPSIYWAFLALQAIVGYHCIILMYAAWRFTKVSDGFYLKKEFKYIALICLIGIPVWNLLALLPQNDDVFPYNSFLMVWVTFGVFTMSTAYPLWMTRKSGVRARRCSRSADASSVLSSRLSTTSTRQSRLGRANNALHSFLTETENGMREFSEHLQREFAIENLLFWKAIEQYKSEFDETQPDVNLKLAWDIVKRFVDDSSALQVNLVATDHRLIRDRMKNTEITGDLFDEPQSHIFRLMATGSFVRFCNQRNEALGDG